MKESGGEETPKRPTSTTTKTGETVYSAEAGVSIPVSLPITWTRHPVSVPTVR